MPPADQPAPTPRTDAEVVVTAGGDRVPVYFARQLERELAAAKAEAERLREALVKLKDAYITARSGQEMTDEEISLAATVTYALAVSDKGKDSSNG